MQLHQIKPKTKNKKHKRVGRGGKRGTYSGRGIKGQKARAGRKMRPEMRDIIKKLPKKRGYRFASFQQRPALVNLGSIDKHFTENEKITPKLLVEKKLVKKIGGKIPIIKLLGGGELSKKIIIAGCRVSKSAKEKIEKLGGNVE